MNFEAVLTHHILDHTIAPLFSIGPIQFNLTKHLVVMWAVAAFLVATLSFAAQSRTALGRMVGTGVEAVALYIREGVVEPTMGHAGHQYLHYFLTLFFFILCANLAGLIPGSATATGNVAVTAGLALCTFGFIVIGGVKAQGLGAFIAHFVPSGVPWWLAPLMFLVEILGLFVRCFALTIRLFANMIAGHIVALGFISLIFIFGAVNQYLGVFVVGPFSLALVTFVNVLELLVATIQAFIFTLLTAVFVGQALHPH